MGEAGSDGERSSEAHHATSRLSVSDDPLVDPNEDELGRGPFVDQTATLIKGVAEDTRSTVFGLVAPWGAGKTSLLNMTRAALERAGWQVVEFNPWEIGEIHALTREFVLTLASALPDTKKGRRAREEVVRYGRRAASFASMLNTPGVDVSKVADALLDAAKPDDSLEGLRRRLIASLERVDTPVLLLIDDVDRLQADELLTLLKLVRLVGRLPNVFYVLAFDEATLRNVLERSDVAGDSERAHAYLEKIVQIRIDVPAPHRTHLLAMADKHLDRVMARFEISLDEREWERFGRIYHDHLAQLLDGPRQIKRFFAQVEAFLPLVASEVDFIDFIVVTMVRVQFPELHSALLSQKRGLTASELRLERPSSAEEEQRWTDFVARHVKGEQAQASALRLLATVFSPVHRALDKWSSGPGDLDSITRRRGVGSSEYFDRYLFLGVPPDDISDAEVREAIREVMGGGGAIVDRIIQIMEVSTNQTALAEPIIDKLRRFAPSDPPSARALLPFAAKVAAHAPDIGFMGRTSFSARGWFAELLAVSDLLDPHDLLDSLEAATSLNRIGWAFLQAGGDGDNPPPNDDERPPFRTELIRRVRRALDWNRLNPLQGESEAESLVKVWAQLDSPAVVRSWLQGAATTPPWTVEDVATFFVERRSLVGRDDWHPGGFDVEFADNLLGLDFILEHLTPSPDGDHIDWNGHAPDTMVERRRRVHAALARVAQDRATENLP